MHVWQVFVLIWCLCCVSGAEDLYHWKILSSLLRRTRYEFCFMCMVFCCHTIRTGRQGVRGGVTPLTFLAGMNAFSALLSYHTKVSLTFKIKSEIVVEELMNVL